MVILATDAPLTSRELKRLAKRALFGLVRAGSLMNHGSGEYAVAFSTARVGESLSSGHPEGGIVSPRQLNQLFQGAAEAAEEAVINSLFRAETMKGRADHCVKALPLERVLQLCKKFQQAAEENG